jgi:hypothetical protein
MLTRICRRTAANLIAICYLQFAIFQRFKTI